MAELQYCLDQLEDLLRRLGDNLDVPGNFNAKGNRTGEGSD